MRTDNGTEIKKEFTVMPNMSRIIKLLIISLLFSPAVMAEYQMESGNYWLDECESYVLKDDRKNVCEQITSLTINVFYYGYVASLVEEYQPKTREELRSLKPFCITADVHISRGFNFEVQRLTKSWF
jgi:hypothetical protein